MCGVLSSFKKALNECMATAVEGRFKSEKMPGFLRSRCQFRVVEVTLLLSVLLLMSIHMRLACLTSSSRDGREPGDVGRCKTVSKSYKTLAKLHKLPTLRVMVTPTYR